MLTNINPPERAVFGETSSGTYQTVKYDKDATNLIPINPNDPNVLNNNKTLTDWQKGIEAIATLDGQKATAIAGMYNSIMFDVTKVIQDYLRPLISEPWHATVKYNISSYAFDNATGAIYKSLVADNLGNALTDNTKWENTGANIQTYIKLIAQNATNITALQGSSIQLSQFQRTVISGGNEVWTFPGGWKIQHGLVGNANITPNTSSFINYHIPYTIAILAPIVAPQSATPNNGITQIQTYIEGGANALTRFRLDNKDIDSTLNTFRWTSFGI